MLLLLLAGIFLKRRKCFEVFPFRMFTIVPTIYFPLRLELKPYEKDQQFQRNNENLISYSKGPAFSFKSINCI